MSKYATISHLQKRKKERLPHFDRFSRDNPVIKGTWQRGGFSGVFAEIGTAQVPYTTFRAVPIWASYSRRYS